MFYLLPNMPPILEDNGEDEVTIAMVEFQKKQSLQRYSRYGSTVPNSKNDSDKLASRLLKAVSGNNSNSNSNEDDSDYDSLASKMVCAKRIQYAAGFITLISIIVVLILTTIKSGHGPRLGPHTPQEGHSSKASPSQLGFDAAILGDSDNVIDENDFDSIIFDGKSNEIDEINSGSISANDIDKDYYVNDNENDN